MKRAFFATLLLAGAAVLATSVFHQTAFAGGEKQTPTEDVERYHMGLWNEGKAVDSDIPLLDIFTPKEFARGYKPEQPIDYSHKVHVGKNHIECTYCHSGVTKSSFATIPSVELCMGCHTQVLKDSPEIKKLAKHWEEKTPVEWKPVNNLPDHAQFNHQRHIKAGFGCQSCHGLVQDMEVVERVSSFKMGFCVSCHRENGANIDCGVCHY